MPPNDPAPTPQPLIMSLKRSRTPNLRTLSRVCGFINRIIGRGDLLDLYKQIIERLYLLHNAPKVDNRAIEDSILRKSRVHVFLNGLSGRRSGGNTAYILRRHVDVYSWGGPTERYL